MCFLFAGAEIVERSERFFIGYVVSTLEAAAMDCRCFWEAYAPLWKEPIGQAVIARLGWKDHQLFQAKRRCAVLILGVLGSVSWP